MLLKEVQQFLHASDNFFPGSMRKCCVASSPRLPPVDQPPHHLLLRSPLLGIPHPVLRGTKRRPALPMTSWMTQDTAPRN
ncbi:hypothetical protein GDO81_016976 [Engystomops pustulosus]|uniref:Uncharacterized protein n=1 Tax=Engystomops pustulosus TaxID=76066 RepID=A0AAV7A9S0_ENGPU|nr:hypothetical protein GDO81_016976 [Engystomops pustulosus]